MDTENYGSLIKDLRIQHGLTQNQVAISLGVTPGYISNVAKELHMTEHISPLSYLIIKEDTDEASVAKASLIFAHGHFL